MNPKKWHQEIHYSKLKTHHQDQGFQAQNLHLVRHDDVIKWKHFPRNWPFVWGTHRFRWIPHTKARDAELWCFLWSGSEKNGWVNNRGAADLRRYRGHYDVTVMYRIEVLLIFLVIVHFLGSFTHVSIKAVIMN